MLPEDLAFLKEWFAGYTQGFYTDDVRDNQNLDLKVAHTSLVCENAVLIGRQERLDQNDLLIAETAALFHDVGRFPQYAKYRTFRDSISTNHGRLGAEVLIEKKVLSKLPSDEQELIINTVRFHNAFETPRLRDSRQIFYLRLIRDADKLDIWRIFSELYHAPADEQASAAGLGLPELPEYSEAVMTCLQERKPASHTDLRTQNDFRLLQLSWVYDLNFRHSFRLMTERQLLEKIASVLPQTKEINGALETIKKYVRERLEMASFRER
jgi:hypothetical protein